MRHKITIISALLVSTFAGAQSAGYQDSDTPSEAIGMMNSSLVVAAKMYEECSRKFPDSANTMKRDLQSWRAKESRAIRVTEYHWSRMEAQEAKLQKMKPYLESIVVRNIENVAAAPFQELGADGALKQYCTGHFAALASGVWRSRTPRTYRFLDEAPDVQK